MAGWKRVDEEQPPLGQPVLLWAPPLPHPVVGWHTGDQLLRPGAYPARNLADWWWQPLPLLPEPEQPQQARTPMAVDSFDDYDTESCVMCGTREDILLPGVGIALGMGGYDVSLCKPCAENTTAAEFFQRIFALDGAAWPPKRKS